MSASVVTAGSGQNLRDLHGRGMNNMSEVYRLPADQIEMDRLSLQHRMWRLMVGGLYPPELAGTVAEVLSAERGSKLAILDIGTGSGIWAAEMATVFPNARVVGLDLAECQIAHVPPNCHFIREDVTQGLQQWSGQFDLVHCRSVAGHLKDAASLMRSIGLCLKSGGLLILADGNFNFFGERKELLQPARDGVHVKGTAWFPRWMAEMKTCVAIKHHEKSTGEELVRWLQDDEHFEGADGQEYFSPINWGGHGIEHGAEIGQLMKTNSLAFIESSKPLFLAGGLPRDTVEVWARSLRAEVLGPTIRMYAKWNVAWARKKRGC